MAESCIQGGIGANVSILANCAPAAALFAETQSRIVLSLPADNLGKLREIVDNNKVECTVLGKVGGDKLRVKVNEVEVISLPVCDMDNAWRNSIAEKMKESGVE